MDIGKILKFAVIGFGALGLVAFFMPLIHVKEANAKVSAWQVVKGLDKVKEGADDVAKSAEKATKILNKAKDTAIDKAAEKSETVRKHAKAVSDGAKTAKYIFYIPFFPAAMFVLIGVLAVFRRFGRGSAISVMLMGLIGIGIWALIRAAAKDVGVQDALGSAVMMLAISYFGATACGLVGLFKPEKEEFR